MSNYDHGNELCVPTPKEATSHPIYLFIIQQMFIEQMLYAGNYVKWFGVRDTKQYKFCLQET